MAQRERLDYIIGLGIEDNATRQLSSIATKIESSVNKINKTIVAPSGRPAAQEMALSTPSFARTAEQNILARQHYQSSRIISAGGYSPSGREYTAIGAQRSTILSNIASSRVARQSSKFDPSLLTISPQTYKEATQGAIELTDADLELNKAHENLSKSSKGLDIDMGKLAIRAAATIPIWFAVRAAFSGTMSVFTEGIDKMVQLDKSLARIKNVMPLTTSEVNKLGETIKKLSVETGRTAEEVGMSFYAFADAGLGATESLAGMNTSIKASNALFTDTKDTARTLADIYVMLGDKITEVSGAENKMNYIMSSIAVLQKSNKFEMEEFREGLKAFTGTAASANLTIDEMLFLLAKAHTYMQRGSAGGTQLARAFQSLEQNMKKLPALGIANPEQMDRFDLMMKVLEVFNTRSEEAKSILSELFTIFEVRGGKVTAPFVENFKEMVKEWEKFKALSPEAKLGDFLKQFEEANDTLENLIKRSQEAKKAIGESFLSGLAGARDYKDFLETGLIPALEKTATLSKLIGITLSGKAPERATSFISDKLKGLAFGNIFAQMLGVKGKPTTVGELDFGPSNKKVEEITQTEERRARTLKDISDRYEYQSLMLDRLQASGYSQIDIEKQRLQLMLEQDATLVSEQELFEQQLKIVGLINEETNKLAGTLNSSVKSSIENILAGTGSIKDLFTNFNTTVQDTFRGQIAEGLTNRLFQNSGLGEMFAGMGVNLKEAFTGGGGIVDKLKGGFVFGGDYSKQSIINGHIVGATQAKTILDGAGLTGDIDMMEDFITGKTSNKISILTSQGTGSDTAANILAMGAEVGMKSGTSGGGFGGFLKNVGTSLFGSGGKGSNILGIGQGGISGGGASGGTFMQNMGSAAGGVMSVVGFGMGLAQSYKAKGTGNVLGGAMNLGMSGAMAGMAVGGPIGAVIGGAIGATVGAIQGGKSKTTEEWETTTNQITSRIDVTNKQLQIVNRNLIGLRTEIKTFMMPTSSYFSEKDSLESNFAVSARRGII